jgi:hypothetical protein
LPGITGVLMLLGGCMLGYRAWRATAAVPVAAAAPATSPPTSGLAQTALAAALCIAFAGLALGRGWPFRVEAALFVFCFIVAFRWREWEHMSHRWRGLAVAALIAVLSTAAIAWLFESVFLVRLP